MLPRVKIIFDNGNLGLLAASTDGVLGLVFAGATAIAEGLQLNVPTKITNLKQVADVLKVTVANNNALFQVLSRFYEQAGTDAELWILALPDTATLNDCVSIANAGKLVTASRGVVNGILVVREPGLGYTPTIVNGADGVLATAITTAQATAVWATDERYSPLFFVIACPHFTGAATSLAALNTAANNRVQVLVGDVVTNSKAAAIGTYGGRIATSPVHRNPARVKDGAIKPTTIFIGNALAENADVATLHDKGYVSFRTFAGRSGYYFTDSPMATLPTDDYSQLTARRTIDKAFRIAYNKLLELLLDEVPVTENGNIQPSFAKSWEATVENEIAAKMTAFGELSADVTNPADKGVQCFINPAQNLVSTSRLNIVVKVRPFGYPRYIDAVLGFTTFAN
jgi:hypothetical protein